MNYPKHISYILEAAGHKNIVIQDKHFFKILMVLDEDHELETTLKKSVVNEISINKILEDFLKRVEALIKNLPNISDRTAAYGISKERKRILDFYEPS